MLFEHLIADARRRPDEVAVVDDRGPYTYRQLATMAAGLGLYVSSQTEKPRVGLLLPTSAAFLASFYGTLLAGKTVVPINFLLSDGEITHIVKDSGIDLVLTVPPLAPKLEALKEAGLKDVPLTIVDLVALQEQFAAMMSGGGEGGAAGMIDQLMESLPAPSADDMAVVLYTSGTSGLPKGVMLTYGNLHSDVEAAIEHAQLTGQHKFLGIIPLFHSTGMLATLVAPVRLGAKIVYQARFSPVAVLQAIREHQISIVAAVPSMYAAIVRLKNAKPDDMKDLYAAISGGEPLSPAVFDAFQQKFGRPIFEGYGLTETIGPIAFNVPAAIKPGSVGRLIPGAEAKMVDDDGNIVPEGESGEILLRGPMIMKGYLNNPEATAQAITPDGFFKTGDLGRIDDDGFLHITGRKKDLIIVAGEKASPREIEDVLMQHPALAEAAVLGKKDPSRGEVVVAFVTVKEGQTVKADELRDLCRQKGLAQWKVPREVFIVDSLPHSPTGKVLKRVLAEQLSGEGPAS